MPSINRRGRAAARGHRGCIERLGPPACPRRLAVPLRTSRMRSWSATRPCTISSSDFPFGSLDWPPMTRRECGFGYPGKGGGSRNCTRCGTPSAAQPGGVRRRGPYCHAARLRNARAGGHPAGHGYWHQYRDQPDRARAALCLFHGLRPGLRGGAHPVWDARRAGSHRKGSPPRRAGNAANDSRGSARRVVRVRHP